MPDSVGRRPLTGLLAGLCVLMGTATGSRAATQRSDWYAPRAQVEPEGTPRRPHMLWYPSPNHDERPPGTAIDMIVVHGTESPGVDAALPIAKYFASRRSGVSAHYVIGKDGVIIQCVPDALAAWHAGVSRYQGREHLNECSIGIELVNDETGHDPFTDAQYRSLVDLVAYLVATYHVRPDRVVGHKDITPNRRIAKTDPAANFDWSRLLGGVRMALGETTVQAGGGPAAESM